MEHPMQTTVQLSKDQKFKQLNDKLNNMLKNKKVDPARIDQTQQKQDK